MDRTTEAKKNFFGNKQEGKGKSQNEIAKNYLRAMKMKEWRQRQVTDDKGACHEGVQGS
jgi:hypothetical protein